MACSSITLSATLYRHIRAAVAYVLHQSACRANHAIRRRALSGASDPRTVPDRQSTPAPAGAPRAMRLAASAAAAGRAGMTGLSDFRHDPSFRSGGGEWFAQVAVGAVEGVRNAVEKLVPATGCAGSWSWSPGPAPTSWRSPA